MFRRFFIILFSSFSCIMLFVSIIRLSNNKNGFLGLSDFLTYVESVDFSEPTNKIAGDIKTFVDNWKSVANEFSQSDNIFDINAINFFSAVGKTLILPFTVIYDLLYLIWGYLKIFIDFVNWIITFEGYTPPVIT